MTHKRWDLLVNRLCSIIISRQFCSTMGNLRRFFSVTKCLWNIYLYSCVYNYTVDTSLGLCLAWETWKFWTISRNILLMSRNALQDLPINRKCSIVANPWTSYNEDDANCRLCFSMSVVYCVKNNCCNLYYSACLRLHCCHLLEGDGNPCEKKKTLPEWCQWPLVIGAVVNEYWITSRGCPSSMSISILLPLLSIAGERGYIWHNGQFWQLAPPPPPLPGHVGAD
jgi:hypothetical protein